MTDDDAYRRYTQINLPHARTILGRIKRSLDALGAFETRGNGGEQALREALDRLERLLEPFDEDPAMKTALAAADAVAALAREMVAALLETPVRGDRLGQNVRNLFECLGLGEEGASVSLECGESPNSPLR